MSTQHNDGWPAFPIAFQHRNESDGVIEQRWPGLSLRDYFAAHASHEDIGAPDTVGGCAKLLGIPPSEYDETVDWVRVVAKARYQYADAMLRAREAK